MATPPVRVGQLISGTDLAMDMRSEFEMTYNQPYDGVFSFLNDWMTMDVPSDKRSETYGYLETVPELSEWRRGDPIPTEGTGSKRFTITNYTYAKRMKWHREDRKDMQLATDLVSYSRQMGEKAKKIPTKIMVEFLTATRSLVPVIPNCPDGVALFSALDGDSANRFQVSGGNIESQTGVTAANITTDFYDCVIRFNSFLDKKSEPFFEPGIGDEGYSIVTSLTNMEAFMSAFKAQIVHSIVAGTSTTNITTGAGTSNLVIASGANVKLNFTSRLTGNNWYIVRSDAPVKPLIMQNREGLKWEEALEDGNNSDEVRNTGTEYVQVYVRQGYGNNIPWAAIKCGS